MKFTVTDISELLKQLTALLTALGVIYVAYMANRTKKKVDTLEANTNNKMDQLLHATNAASFIAGGDAERAKVPQAVEIVQPPDSPVPVVQAHREQ